MEFSSNRRITGPEDMNGNRTIDASCAGTFKSSTDNIRIQCEHIGSSGMITIHCGSQYIELSPSMAGQRYSQLVSGLRGCVVSTDVEGLRSMDWAPITITEVD